MYYTPLTCRALLAADTALEGRRSIEGLPYIFHSAHVAEWMDNEEEVIAAVLHDAVEQGCLAPDDLATQGFPPVAISALRRLIRPEGMSELEYYTSIKEDEIALKVKLADLKHNARRDRTETFFTPNESGKVRGEYRAAIDFLEGKETVWEPMPAQRLERIDNLPKCAPGYQIKLHVYKEQVYSGSTDGPETTFYEHDEYRRLRRNEVILESDMMRVSISDIVIDKSGPVIWLSIINKVVESGDGEWLFGQRVARKKLGLGDIVHVEDAGLNCSDYYVRYTFDVSIAEGDYTEESS